MAKQKNYDDKFKASIIAMLVASGYPDNKHRMTEIAKHAGVPLRTLRRWYLGQYGAPPDKSVQEEKKALSDRLEELTHRLIDAAFTVAADTESMNIQQVTTSIGIAVDKLQLLEGKATERVDHTGLTDEARADRIAELVDRGRARRDGRADSEYVQ